MSVYGKRIIDNSMPIHRWASNKLTSWIISMLCGQSIYDSQCGYRRYSVKSVLDTKCTDNGFQFESEVLIKLLRYNCTHANLEIPTIYSLENSSINNFSDNQNFVLNNCIISKQYQICTYILSDFSG